MDGSVWQLNPDFVSETPGLESSTHSAQICESCASFVDAWNVKFPGEKCGDSIQSFRSPSGIAGGHDFGDLRHLPIYRELFEIFTDMDWLAVAPGRYNGLLIKVSGTGLGVRRRLRGNEF